MNLPKILKNLMTLTLLAAGAASANPGRYPGGGGNHNGGGYRPPGPVRPNPDDNVCRETRNRDPRCDRGDRGDRGGGGRHDGGYRPRPRPQPPYNPPYNPPYSPPYQPPYNPPPVYNPPPPIRGESSIVIPSITRRAGGEWIRVNIHNPLRVDYVQLRVLNGALQVHEAFVMTSRGVRFSMRELTRTGVFTTGRVSEILNLNEEIVAVDLRAEAMGGYTDAQLSVISYDGSASLSVGRY